jgi:hypothetical protein
MPALPHRRHPNEGAPDPFPAGTFEAPEAQPTAELGERPRGRLAKALMRALPGGLMLIDPQATVYVRSGRPRQVLALVLHEAHCHHEFLEAIGMGARPRQASLAASAEVMVVPKADGSMLCIGGSVPDLLPLSDWGPPPARERNDGCREALFLCVARSFPNGWIYAFDSRFDALLGVGNVLSLSGCSRSRIEGMATLRWFARTPSTGRCVLPSGSMPFEYRRGRLAIHSPPDGMVLMSFTL